MRRVQSRKHGLQNEESEKNSNHIKKVFVMEQPLTDQKF